MKGLKSQSFVLFNLQLTSFRTHTYRWHKTMSISPPDFDTSLLGVGFCTDTSMHTFVVKVFKSCPTTLETTFQNIKWKLKENKKMCQRHKNLERKTIAICEKNRDASISSARIALRLLLTFNSRRDGSSQVGLLYQSYPNASRTAVRVYCSDTKLLGAKLLVVGHNWTFGVPQKSRVSLSWTLQSVLYLLTCIKA